MKKKKEKKVSRFGVSLDADLLISLDKYRVKKKYSNRSQAISSIIEEVLSHEEEVDDREAVGILLIIYNHHKIGLVEKLISLQHDSFVLIVSNNHIHLDGHLCLEIITLKGKAKDLQSLSDSIISLKGIKNGKLVLY